MPRCESTGVGATAGDSGKDAAPEPGGAPTPRAGVSCTGRQAGWVGERRLIRGGWAQVDSELQLKVTVKKNVTQKRHCFLRRERL